MPYRQSDRRRAWRRRPTTSDDDDDDSDGDGDGDGGAADGAGDDDNAAHNAAAIVASAVQLRRGRNARSQAQLESDTSAGASCGGAWRACSASPS
jgi:hypothetical protein